MLSFMTFCSLGKSEFVELGGQKNAVDITADDFFQKDERKRAVMMIVRLKLCCIDVCL